MGSAAKPRREVAAGVTMAAIGILVVIESTTYTIGDAARMGPGYFPLLLGAVLAVLGVIIAFSVDPEEPEKFEAAAAADDATKDIETAALPPSRKDVRMARLRGMGCIIGGIVAFMIIGRYGGLVPATFALVLISAMGDLNNRVTSSLVLATAVTIIGTLIFHWGLQLQFPLLRWG